MPRAPTNLEPLREQITAWHEAGKKMPEVMQRLEAEYNITIKRTQLYTRYKRWGLKSQERTEDNEALRAQIKELFFHQFLPDDLMLKRLREDGFTITKTRLATIRREEQLYRRHSPEQAQIAIEKAYAFIEEQNQQSAALQSLGRGLFHVRMRQNEHVISRDAAYQAYRHVMGENVSTRFGNTPFRRRTFNIRGVNEVWSIDGHNKLEPWGFEIYAGIDAWARYLTWFYCGVCNSTAWNIALQYLSLLKRRKTMPLKLRSDHGSETSMICALHFFLSSRRKKPRSISTEIQLPGGADEIKTEQQEEELVPIEFKDCWVFGRSIHNTRIESWWHLLYTGVIHRWRDYFQWLTDNGHFTSGYLADQVAILFMYMNLIRKECHDYVSDWNIHRIRSQPYNSHVVTGQVNVLYYDTDAPQVAELVPEDLLRYCAEKLGLDHADLDAFLPAETMTICSRIIEEQFGCLPEKPRNVNFPFVHEYIKLKRELQRYIDEKRRPAISLIEQVTEGRTILENMLKEHDLTLTEDGAFYDDQYM